MHVRVISGTTEMVTRGDIDWPQLLTMVDNDLNLTTRSQACVCDLPTQSHEHPHSHQRPQILSSRSITMAVEDGNISQGMDARNLCSQEPQLARSSQGSPHPVPTPDIPLSFPDTSCKCDISSGQSQPLLCETRSLTDDSAHRPLTSLFV